jgi:hypothetical protein
VEFVEFVVPGSAPLASDYTGLGFCFLLIEHTHHIMNNGTLLPIHVVSRMGMMGAGVRTLLIIPVCKHT